VSAQDAVGGNARQAFPQDIEGYWVSLVTEDWRYRMMSAPAGDFEGINLTQPGRDLAEAWDPQADAAAGEACRAYGAGGAMRYPTRLHISWAEDNVLQIDTDKGQQTRLLKFGAAQDNEGAGSWQGVSQATLNLYGPAGAQSGRIDVVTSQMRPGYIRRNGVPYSAQALITEYFSMVTEEDGSEYLIVVSELEDPVFLQAPVLRSTTFLKESDASKWDPSECISGRLLREPLGPPRERF